MKHRVWLTCLLLIVSVSGAVGYEFWLQPARFFVSPGMTIRVQTLVGERFTGELSEGHKKRIVLYKHHSASGTVDLSAALAGDHYGETSVKLTQPGTHVLVFANTPKFIRMEPDQFLNYLNEDGLDNVIAAREEAADTLKPGYELYSRCAKTMVQVGDNPDPTLPASSSLTLDIVPLQNPYTLRAGQRLRLQILFNNKPQPDALVRYWAKSETGQVEADVVRSDRRGQVQFKLKAGQNMVSTVRMIPAPINRNVPETADWRSYWSSLTFGCRP
ncbi:hypothetical protein FAES_3359 [Fibrella aestuarina BUZ 2]|uniref:DUF4198 domain-containing protein n=1 Tax=Fibrella aestuarina BUZ 2 TaxID=1166018 RepID=I0KB64_9BACT|nr:DUF4198 domain-containing protein [Fibrella aestuarina]CCH01367.1 hypothetical protein FAES_3359 [Fibrella aestuarina BUZ 2]